MNQEPVVVATRLDTKTDHRRRPFPAAGPDGSLQRADPRFVQTELDWLTEELSAAVSDQPKRVVLADIDPDQHRPGRPGLAHQPQESSLILTTNKRHNGTSSTKRSEHHHGCSALSRGGISQGSTSSGY
jgi:hypothetical protein